MYFGKQAISVDSSYHRAYLNLSRVYLMQKEYEKSKEMLEVCPLNTTYLAQFYLNYALLYKEIGEPMKVLKYLEKGLESDAEPFDAFVFNNFGFEFEELRDYKKAIKAYNRSIGLDVNYSFSYNNRANVKFKLKDFEGACRDWHKALEKGYVYKPEWKEEYGIENPNCKIL